MPAEKDTTRQFLLGVIAALLVAITALIGYYGTSFRSDIKDLNAQVYNIMKVQYELVKGYGPLKERFDILEGRFNDHMEEVPDDEYYERFEQFIDDWYNHQKKNPNQTTRGPGDQLDQIKNSRNGFRQLDKN